MGGYDGGTAPIVDEDEWDEGGEDISCAVEEDEYAGGGEEGFYGLRSR